MEWCIERLSQHGNYTFGAIPKYDYVSKYYLSIYNRWGQRIYEATDINNGWNDTYKGGPCMIGAYVFSYTPNKYLPYESTEIQSWVYSISVGNTGESWYKNANSKALAKSSAELAVSYGIISSRYGAMAILAIEGISVFAIPPQGTM